MPPKSDDVRFAQLRMITCLIEGNRKTARFWARVAGDRRQHDARSMSRDRDDWVDRCGW
jgi:hypothetical protein